MKIKTFKSIELLNNEIERILKDNTFKKEKVTDSQVRTFLKKNKELITSQQGNRKLHDNLGFLLERIKKEFPKESDLRDEIIKIADQVFKIPLDTLPQDILGLIISESLPKIKMLESNFYEYDTPVLKATRLISKKFKLAYPAGKNRWIGEQGICLKKFGCETAEQAVNYAIKCHLTGANLEYFTDLDDDQLERLITSCPNLGLLFIKSDKVTQKSADKISKLKELKKLSIENDTIKTLNLENNLALQEVKCKARKLVQLTLPKKTPFLQCVNCCECICLAQLALPVEAPALREVNCRNCWNLTHLHLPEVAPALEELNCDGCSTFEQLLLPKKAPVLRIVTCNGCWQLKDFVLPTIAPALEGIFLSACKELTRMALPKVAPALSKVDCNFCPQLTQLTLPEEAPLLRAIYCKKCLKLSPENIKNYLEYMRRTPLFIYSVS